MTCSVHFNVQSEGSISQLWDTYKDKIEYVCPSDTHEYKV